METPPKGIRERRTVLGGTAPLPPCREPAVLLGGRQQENRQEILLKEVSLQYYCPPP